MTHKEQASAHDADLPVVNTWNQQVSTMSIMFRRIRGRAAGHVVTVNPLLICSIEPTTWGGSEINFSDVYAVVSRDNPHTVQLLLEGRLRLCQTPLCDRDTTDAYSPVCTRHRDGVDEVYEAAVADLVVVGGKHGFRSR